MKRILCILILCIFCGVCGIAGYLLPLPKEKKIDVTVSEAPSISAETDDKTAGYVIPAAMETEAVSDPWISDGVGRWSYRKPDGSMAEGWQEIDDGWYFFGSDGMMQTGWLENGGKWYYLDASGEMRTGWVKADGIWYYLDSKGVLLTNTNTPDGYYVDNSGALGLRP